MRVLLDTNVFIYWTTDRDINTIAAKSDKAVEILHCKGEEAKDHRNSCPTKLEYAICVEYRKGSVR